MKFTVLAFTLIVVLLLSLVAAQTSFGLQQQQQHQHRHTSHHELNNKHKSAPMFEPGQRINWNTIRTVSKSLATCQAVTNPLFNEITTPVAKTAWQSLKKLDLSRARFAAWYVYPQWSIPEPYPPKWSEDGTRCESTSWDFTGLMSQLGPFLKNVRSTVFEISTLPIWFFSSAGNSQKDYNHSIASNDVDWSYSGIGRWRANTSQLAGDYWGRIASYLLMGSMVDECGQTHSGGPAYLLQQAAKTGIPIVWEIGNEPKAEWRGADVYDYVATYDRVVTSIRRVIPRKYHHLIQFQGLAMNVMTEYSWSWWKTFLDPAQHVPEARDSINWASAHFYSDINSRYDNATWEWRFFDPVDEFQGEVAKIVALRDAINPNRTTQTRLSFDEMGSILAGDNDPGIAYPEDLYYVGSGALFAYIFAKLSVVGADVIGESQLAGVPVIKKWNINNPQFMSVSMLNWTTGTGNARYYALQLIKDEFSPTPVGPTNEPPEQIIHPPAALPPRQQMCAAHWAGDPLKLGISRFVNLSCSSSSSAYIDKIQMAHVGYILGHCANDFALDTANCTDDGGVALELVKDVCVGKASCSLNLDSFALLAPQCANKSLPLRLVVKATCSDNSGGYASPSAYLADRVFVQARTDAATGAKKLLVINKNNNYAPLELEQDLKGSRMRMLAKNNEAPVESIIETNATHPFVMLPPFATAVITLM